MRVLAKNIKGFTILEVIVVLCLVGIISAIAYPNIDTWNKTRKVKTEVLRAVNIFENINENELAKFEKNLLEYPQYTKPNEFKGMKIPDILLSGNHKVIKEWQKNQALSLTKLRRPDLIDKKKDKI